MIGITTLAFFTVVAQQADVRYDAQYPSENWELEYPAVIGEYIDGYYNCLKNGSYTIGGNSSFEEQYRLDIERCEKKGKTFEADANGRLSGGAHSADNSPIAVARIFETIRRIHVGRGASLDRATRSRIIASTAYAETRKVNGAPPTCVAYVNDLRDARLAYVRSEGAKAKAAYDKAEYLDEDRQLVMAYNAELLRMTDAISLELKACPEANYAIYDQRPASAAGPNF